MVKIKNPDENLLNGNHTIAIGDSDIKISTNDITDSKRFVSFSFFLIDYSKCQRYVYWQLFFRYLFFLLCNRSLNVPHRSLPDIPISDPNQLDTNSDLYATVGDKVGDKPHGQSRKQFYGLNDYDFVRVVFILLKYLFAHFSDWNDLRLFHFSASSGVKKQISVSQHSSISQADDCSSPYARVRSHAYDKVRPAEHPYAQVKSVGDNANNRPSTSTATAPNNNSKVENNNPSENESLSRRSSRESLLDSVDGRQHQVSEIYFFIAHKFALIKCHTFLLFQINFMLLLSIAKKYSFEFLMS